MSKNSRNSPNKKNSIALEYDATVGVSPVRLPAIPLTDGEDEGEFLSFKEGCRADIQPKGAIEEIWFGDYVNFTWESNRLQRIKIAVIQSTARQAVADLLMEFGDQIFKPGDRYHERTARADDISRSWAQKDPTGVKIVDYILAQHGLNQEAIMAKALSSQIEVVEHIDKLMAAAETRRDKALTNIERHRIQRARFRGNVTDANYEVFDAAE